jgi:hypothetical protein
MLLGGRRERRGLLHHVLSEKVDEVGIGEELRVDLAEKLLERRRLKRRRLSLGRKEMRMHGWMLFDVRVDRRHALMLLEWGKERGKQSTALPNRMRGKLMGRETRRVVLVRTVDRRSSLRHSCDGRVRRTPIRDVARWEGQVGRRKRCEGGVRRGVFIVARRLNPLGLKQNQSMDETDGVDGWMGVGSIV